MCGQAHNPATAGSAGSNPAPATNLLAARRPVRKVQRRSIERITIQSSSVVERSAVNRLVVGSNPTSGAILGFDFVCVPVEARQTSFVLRDNRTTLHRRIRRLGHDMLSTMKTLFSIIVAFAVCVGGVQAGPVRTARNVAKDSAITARNVAHSVVKGTRRAVHTVVYAFTR